MHPHSPSLVAEDVSFVAADGRLLLRPVSLRLGRERVGLVGRNGIGKTLLARILAGDLPPSTGGVLASGRLSYLPQRLSFDGLHTVGDALGAGPALAALARIEAGSAAPEDFEAVGADWDLADRAAVLLSRLGLPHLRPERPLHGLSGGERTRVALAGQLLARPDVLLLDEPTNNLDEPSRLALQAALDAFPGALLVVSHDRALLGRMEAILELTEEGIARYGGGWEAYRTQRAALDAALDQEITAARQDVGRERRERQEARERQDKRDREGKRRAREGGIPRIAVGAMKRRAESTRARMEGVHGDRLAEAQAALAAARARLRPENDVRLDLSATRVPGGKTVAELRGIRHVLPDGRALFGDGLDLTVVGPERLALTGPNGAGKTTLLRILLGELTPTHGEVRLGVGRVAWLDQGASGLPAGQSILDTFRDREPHLPEEACRLALARFRLRGDTALRSPETLSGGERVRATLAVTLSVGGDAPQLLILDEPTNDLDVDTLEQVESALADYQGALIVVSHDSAFRLRLGLTREVALAPPSPPARTN